MKRTIPMIAISLLLLTTACSQAREQGVVQVETEWGKIVQVHEPGHNFSCMSPWCDEYEVDLRDHVDGVDCSGVSSDNVPFYMKVDVVHRPIRERVADYIGLFGAENNEHQRDAKRYAVLKQHVSNACRNATSGRYDAYGLREKQGEILAAMQAELTPKLSSEMALHLSSVGMEIQPQFTDPRIDDAANAVVAAQKKVDAETALRNAANIAAERQQVEAKIYANPNAMKIEELKLMLEIEKVRSEGIARHQGTLILGNSSSTQLQVPGGK